MDQKLICYLSCVHDALLHCDGRCGRVQCRHRRSKRQKRSVMTTLAWAKLFIPRSFLLLRQSLYKVCVQCLMRYGSVAVFNFPFFLSNLITTITTPTQLRHGNVFAQIDPVIHKFLLLVTDTMSCHWHVTSWVQSCVQSVSQSINAESAYMEKWPALYK